jgi:transglutaminase-like putative cysteine protease
MRTLGSWDSENGPSLYVKFGGIDEELHFLRGVVDTWRQSPLIRNLAVEILKGTNTPERDKKAQALAIGQHVQNAIYYVHELPERFQTPVETLRLAAGDCDDTTVLIGALLEAVGIPSALVAMKWSEEWRHIFPAAVLPGGTYLPLDSTMTASVGEVKNPVLWATRRGYVVTLKVV